MKNSNRLRHILRHVSTQLVRQFNKIGGFLLASILLFSGSLTWGNEIQVNSTLTDDQEHPAVAIDADGNFVVVWHSNNNSGPDTDENGVFGRRYDRLGNPYGPEFLVNTITADDQQNAEVAINQSNGDFVVVWESKSAGTSYDIYAQCYNSSGVPQFSPPILVNSITADFQRYPVVAVANSGDFVVAWQGDYSTNGYDIFFRRFNSAGIPLLTGGSTNDVNVTNAPGEQQDPQIAMSASGGFVIVWEDLSGNDDIYFRRFNPVGVPLGPTPSIVNATIPNNQRDPQIAINTSGAFVVVWESDVSGTGDYKPIARRFNSGGVANGGEIDVLASTGILVGNNPVIILNPSGGEFLVAWESPDSSNDGIYSRIFDSSGSPVTGAVLVNETETNDQSNPASAIGSNGDIVLAWDGAQTGDVDVYAFSQEFYDFGDAPYDGGAYQYPTLLANNGARHLLNSAAVYLGLSVDSESDGNPSVGAVLDDASVGNLVLGSPVGNDDEDGVTFTSPLYLGLPAPVDVIASANCILFVWIDFNADGDWKDAGENLYPAGIALTTGSNALNLPIPPSATTGPTYARFRCTTQAVVLSDEGLAPDGEVEDYRVEIVPVPKEYMVNGDGSGGGSGKYWPGVSGYFDARFLPASIAGNSDTYPAWCADEDTFIKLGWWYNDVDAFSSLGFSNSCAPFVNIGNPANLPLVNYLLSVFRTSTIFDNIPYTDVGGSLQNGTATNNEIQAVIWRLLFNGFPSLGVLPPSSDPNLVSGGGIYWNEGIADAIYDFVITTGPIVSIPYNIDPNLPIVVIIDTRDQVNLLEIPYWLYRILVDWGIVTVCITPP